MRHNTYSVITWLRANVDEVDGDTHIVNFLHHAFPNCYAGTACDA